MGLGDLWDSITSGFGNFGNTVGDFFADVGVRGSEPSDEAMFQQMLGQQDTASGADPFTLEAILSVLLGMNPGGELMPSRGYSPEIIAQAERLGIKLPDPAYAGKGKYWGRDWYDPDAPVAVGGDKPMTGRIGEAMPENIVEGTPTTKAVLSPEEQLWAEALRGTSIDESMSQPATMSDVAAMQAEAMMRSRMETQREMQFNEAGDPIYHYTTGHRWTDNIEQPSVRYEPTGQLLRDGSPLQAKTGANELPLGRHYNAQGNYPGSRTSEVGVDPRFDGPADPVWNSRALDTMRPGGRNTNIFDWEQAALDKIPPSALTPDDYAAMAQARAEALDVLYGYGQDPTQWSVDEQTGLADLIPPTARDLDMTRGSSGAVGGGRAEGASGTAEIILHNTTPQTRFVREEAVVPPRPTLGRLAGELAKEGIPNGYGRFVGKYSPKDALEEFMMNKLGYQQGIGGGPIPRV
jgi:hypothetical protein